MNRSDFPETWDDEAWDDIDYGSQATDLISQKRDPMALCNQMFEEWSRSQ